jgi:hypothetical protein
VILKKMLLFLVIVAIFLLAGGVSFAYYVLETNPGLVKTSHFVLNHFIPAEIKSIQQVRGTLRSSMTWQNVELKNIKGLPPGTLLIQRLTIVPHGMDYKHAEVRIFNARLKLKYSDNIILSGTYHNGVLNFSVFSEGIDVGEILQIAQVRDLPIRGGIKKIDLHVDGTMERPRIQGSFFVERLVGKDFTLSKTPGTLDLEVSDIQNDLKLKGNIRIQKGQFQSRKTKITLKESAIYFSHNPKNPTLALDGYSHIGDVDIDISVKGTVEKPDLKLESDPPLDSEILMVMLATGRKWQGLEELEQGQLSADLAKDFIGYLFFPGSGEGFLDKIGVTNVKLNVANGQKEIGFKKEVTDKFDVGYDLQQKTLGSSTQPAIYQTLGADYKVSNKLYASFERQASTGTNASNDQDIDNRFLLKYKKKF